MSAKQKKESKQAEVAEVAAEEKPKKPSKAEVSLRRFPVLTDEEAAEVARVARPAKAPCLCGCGGLTKGRFVPGHDATLKVRLENTAVHGEGKAQADAKAALVAFGW